MKRLTEADLAPPTGRMVETASGLEYQADEPDCRVRIAFPDALWSDPRWRWFRDRILRPPVRPHDGAAR